LWYCGWREYHFAVPCAPAGWWLAFYIYDNRYLYFEWFLIRIFLLTHLFRPSRFLIHAWRSSFVGLFFWIYMQTNVCSWCICEESCERKMSTNGVLILPCRKPSGSGMSFFVCFLHDCCHLIFKISRKYWCSRYGTTPHVIVVVGRLPSFRWCRAVIVVIIDL
jgi:hypothetical protein